MIIADTNVVSEALKPTPSPKVIEWLSSLSHEVCITAITMAELLYGVELLPAGRRKSALRNAMHTILNDYTSSNRVLAFDSAAALQFAPVLVLRQGQGRPISTADAQIAAICRAHNALCATRNTTDFEGTGVTLINPWND